MHRFAREHNDSSPWQAQQRADVSHGASSVPINLLEFSLPPHRCPLPLALFVVVSNAQLALLKFPQSAFPKNDSNLFEWAGTIEGAVGTVRLLYIFLTQRH